MESTFLEIILGEKMQLYGFNVIAYAGIGEGRTQGACALQPSMYQVCIILPALANCFGAE